MPLLGYLHGAVRVVISEVPRYANSTRFVTLKRHFALSEIIDSFSQKFAKKKLI